MYIHKVETVHSDTLWAGTRVSVYRGCWIMEWLLACSTVVTAPQNMVGLDREMYTYSMSIHKHS
jgi:hypothetical protein